MKVKSLILILFHTFLVQNLMANAAQPGIYSSGGAAFNLLITHDSLAFNKLQMVDEKIYIQLYKGFAVVKGVYQIQNNSPDSINFKMGYPINGIYQANKNYTAQEIEFTDLYNFQVKVNNENVPLQTQFFHEENVLVYQDTSNWKIWNCEYFPHENKLIEVYFIVKTNDAFIREGYEKEQKNAFIYLFESGATWGNPILKGELTVQFMNNLTYKNVHGMSNPFSLNYNTEEKILFGNFEEFTPENNDNFIITYGEFYNNFDFNNIIENHQNYYTNINNLSTKNISHLEFTNVKSKNPFDTKTTFWGIFPFLLFKLFIYLPFIIGGIILTFIVIFLYKKIKK